MKKRIRDLRRAIRGGYLIGYSYAEMKVIILVAIFAKPEKAGEYHEVKTINVVDTRQVRTKLGWTKMKPADRVNDATLKVAIWNASTYCPPPFPANIPAIAAFLLLITALQTALAAVGGKKATSKQAHAIKTASRNLQLAAEQIMSVWQNKIYATPSNAIAIADDGGFEYSIAGIHGKRKSGGCP